MCVGGGGVLEAEGQRWERWCEGEKRTNGYILRQKLKKEVETR